MPMGSGELMGRVAEARAADDAEYQGFHEATDHSCTPGAFSDYELG